MLNDTFSVIFKHRALCFLNSKMYLHLCESGIDAENVVFVPQNPRILSSQNPVDFASEWEFAIDMNFPWDLVSLQEEKEKDFFRVILLIIENLCLPEHDELLGCRMALSSNSNLRFPSVFDGLVGLEGPTRRPSIFGYVFLVLHGHIGLKSLHVWIHF